MMRNKKNGITLVAIICVVFVLLILSSTIAISFNNIYISTNKKEFASEIYNIQKLVDQYYFKNTNYPVKGDDIYFFDEINGSLITAKEVDLYEAGADETKRGQRSDSDDEDIYIVSDAGVVYYKKGQKIGDQTYYTLTDELKKQLGLIK